MSQYELSDRAKLAALRLLSHRPRSVKELRDRLTQRFPDDVVEATVSSLLETSLLDDEAFARWWTSSRTGSRPMSAAMISAELKKKGLAPDVIARALASVDDEANARALARRVARSIPADDFEHFARRLSGRMARRGYSDSLVQDLLEETWAEALIASSNGPLSPACRMVRPISRAR